MVLTISRPAAAGLAGPGYDLSVHTSLLGPYPADDWVQCSLVNTASPDFNHVYATGQGLVASFNPCLVQMGILIPGFSAPEVGAPSFPASGGAISIYAEWRHANGFLFDSGVITGWTWDPIGGLGALLAQINDNIINGASVPGSGLSAILRAVQKTF